MTPQYPPEHLNLRQITSCPPDLLPLFHVPLYDLIITAYDLRNHFKHFFNRNRNVLELLKVLPKLPPTESFGRFLSQEYFLQSH